MFSLVVTFLNTHKTSFNPVILDKGLQRFRPIPDFGWGFMYLTKVHGNSDKLQRMLLHYQLYLSAGFQMEIVIPLRKLLTLFLKNLEKAM